MHDQVNVLCMKWGTKFGPEYVNKLYAMVARNISLPFRFVCLTDDVEGVRSDVECFPLPALELPDGTPERGWNKLTTFIDCLYDLKGKTLFLDLDVVIVDNIDCFFDQQECFYIIRDFVRKDGTGNSSVYVFNAGKHVDIIDYFSKNFEEIKSKHCNEQEFLSHYLLEKGQLNYWPDEWCPSFKYNCLPGVWGSWFKSASIPEGARIIIFHGSPKAEEAISGYSKKWYRHIKPCAWVAEYWRE